MNEQPIVDDAFAGGKWERLDRTCLACGEKKLIRHVSWGKPGETTCVRCGHTEEPEKTGEEYGENFLLLLKMHNLALEKIKQLEAENKVLKAQTEEPSDKEKWIAWQKSTHQCPRCEGKEIWQEKRGGVIKLCGCVTCGHRWEKPEE
jgi:hypothetical protein